MADIKPTLTVARRVPGAPSSGDSDSAATSLIFSVAVLNLDALGDGGTHAATVVDQRGRAIGLDTGPTYESSDTSVFTVDSTSGAITAVGEGVAILIARADGVRPALFTVTVKQVPSAVAVSGTDSISFGSGVNRVAASVAVAGDAGDLTTSAVGTDLVASSLTLSPSGTLDLDVLDVAA